MPNAFPRSCVQPRDTDDDPSHRLPDPGRGTGRADADHPDPLGRSELRELRTYLRLSLEAVRADRFELPYRLTCTSTKCGFLVLPGSAEFRLRAREALESLAVASKYELGMDRQVSLAMWRSGEIIDIDWLYTDGPNPPDEKLDKRLEHAYPFRTISEKG